jgi:hypothetical protein
MGKSSWNDSSASLPPNWRDNENGLGGTCRKCRAMTQRTRPVPGRCGRGGTVQLRFGQLCQLSRHEREVDDGDHEDRE